MRVSGPQMTDAPTTGAEIAVWALSGVDMSAIPPRLLAELARYRVDDRKAWLLRRHADARTFATLLPTAMYPAERADAGGAKGPYRAKQERVRPCPAPRRPGGRVLTG